MAYPEYDPNEPSLGQTFADLLRGMSKKQSYQELGQGIQNTAKVLPSVGESLGRGALVQLPAFVGDVSQTARQIAPETMQNTFGNRYMPTSEEILAKVPRMTPDYQGSQSHEMMGGVLSPAMPFLLRAGAEATKGLPIGNMIAYHGTPHEIKGAFDISKVGTGEGAQSYGHGMYFAENPTVAEGYKEALSTFKTTLDGVPITSDNPKFSAVMTIGSQGYKKALEQAELAKKSGFVKPEIANQEIANIKALKNSKIESVKQGNLYKVDIPDKDIPNMLDWDKPLLQQTPQVQEALAKLGIKSDKQKLSQFDDALLDALMNDGKTALPKQPINPTGSSIYQTIIQGNPQFTSQKLNEAGIRGIRYLDEGSRNVPKYSGDIAYIHAGNDFKKHNYTLDDALSGMKQAYKNANVKELKDALNEVYGIKPKQTSNFVVFDPKEVKILEKNNNPVTRKDILEQAFEGTMPHYKNYENLSSVFEKAGLKVKETGSSKSNSKYVEIEDPTSGEIVTARFANHPQSGQAMTLHGPADIEIGDIFKHKSWEDAVNPILDRINKARKVFGDQPLILNNKIKK